MNTKRLRVESSPALMAMRRITFYDVSNDDRSLFGGAKLFLKDIKSICIAFNDEELKLPRTERGDVVCEVFIHADWEIEKSGLFPESTFHHIANPTGTKQEMVTFSNSTLSLSKYDMYLVRGDRWYHIKLSENDKIIHWKSMDAEGGWQSQPAICLGSCKSPEEHCYYVRPSLYSKLPDPPVSRLSYDFSNVKAS